MVLTERRRGTEAAVLFGKYQLERVIGRGRSGTVFLARHIGLDEERAIKRVGRTEGGLIQEAALLKRLRHPGIPIIYDLEIDENYYYLIEEYLHGESLYARIERAGSLQTGELIHLGIELCRIMNYLHSFEPNPILYLDLHPGNILICREQLKLIDFDQAVLASWTQERSVCYGTKGFAAPEQYEGGTLDERTDIYAIGALLYFMGNGHAPEGELEAGQGECRGDLHSIVGRCLRKEKKERYQSVREVLAALEKLEARIFAERHIPLLRIAAVGSRSGAGVTHTALGAVRYLRRQGCSCLYREQNDTGAVRKLASWYGAVPDEQGIYYMDGLALKPRYSDVVKLTQPVFEVILDDCGTGLQTVLEGEYDLILLICGLQPWEKEDSLRAIRVLGGQDRLLILLNHRKYGRDYLPEEVRHLNYLRLPFLAAPFDAGGRRGEGSEAAEEMEFFEIVFQEVCLSKGPRAGKKRALWSEITETWENLKRRFTWRQR